MSTYYALDSTYIISFDCHNILVRLAPLLPYPFYRAGKLRLRQGKGVIQRVRRKGSQVEDTAHAKAWKWASQMVHRYDRSPICWELTLWQAQGWTLPHVVLTIVKQPQEVGLTDEETKSWSREVTCLSKETEVRRVEQERRAPGERPTTHPGWKEGCLTDCQFRRGERR